MAQPTKHAFLFVFNRETGEPIWPIEERPVPQSDVPKERTSPTQPFPTKPAPFDRQGITENDLLDLTPALKAEALEVVEALQDGAAVHAAGGELGRRPAGNADAAVRGRWRQLAGRLIRSGEQPPVHPLARAGLRQRGWCRANPGAVGHGIRRRTGARRRRRGGGGGARRRRRGRGGRRCAAPAAVRCGAGRRRWRTWRRDTCRGCR